MIENRHQLIGLLSTTSGYADRHPSDAAEILTCIEAAGLLIVPAEPTRAMWAAGGDAAVGKTSVHHDAVIDPVWRAMTGASPTAT